MIKFTVEIIIFLMVVIRLPLSRQQQCQEGNWHAGFSLTLFTFFPILYSACNYSSMYTTPYIMYHLVSTGISGIDGTVAPVVYNGIEPNGDQCIFIAGVAPFCGSGSVLGDGDIGSTHSVDVSDRDLVRRFFVWHRDNGTVTLEFSVAADDLFDVSYIDIYTLSIPSARIGSPTISFSTNNTVISVIGVERCSFSSSINTLSRITYTVSLTNIGYLTIRFQFTNQDIDWLFISEIQLCAGDPPSSISCDPPRDPPTTPSTSPPSSPPTPRAPTITLSSPPPTGVTPDLRQPDSVSLTCSVASPPTDDYQYQWQWLKSRTLLSSDSRFTITHTTNTQSSSLQISGLQYSDAGEYMCKVQYTMCPEEVDCSGSTPVTGNIQLYLPGKLYYAFVFTCVSFYSLS